MSTPYAKDVDIKSDGTTRSNYKNLKSLRLEQRSTKSQYECIPQWTRRAHFKLLAADTTVVTDETSLRYIAFLAKFQEVGQVTSSTLPEQRLNVLRVWVKGNLSLFWQSRGSPTTLRAVLEVENIKIERHPVRSC